MNAYLGSVSRRCIYGVPSSVTQCRSFISCLGSLDVVYEVRVGGTRIFVRFIRFSPLRGVGAGDGVSWGVSEDNRVSVGDRLRMKYGWCRGYRLSALEVN